MMSTESQKSNHPASRAHASRPWIPYTAAAWAVVFAIVSFYWASGGTIGIGTLARSIQQLGRERSPSFVAEVWATGVLKLVAAAIALALIRPWGKRIAPRLLRILIWGTGVTLLLYGGSNLIQDVLIVAGVIDVPKSMGPEAVRWYLFLWEPWWILGGVLFLATAWQTRGRPEPD